MFKKLTFISLTFLFFLAIWGVLIEPRLLTLREVHVQRWKGTPLKIAFFSDLHAGAPFIDEMYIQNLVHRINEMKPDLILIGGDLVINGIVGGNPLPFEKVVFNLQKLQAHLGVYAVLGNHDWWNNAEQIKNSLERAGIPVLDNQARLISVNPQTRFWLVGIGDEFTKHANPDSAMSQITSTDPQILFMHDPAALFQIKNHFFMALAGHLHGGQVYIPGLGAIITPGKAPRTWASGWVPFALGSVFVSTGIGTSILPVRVNALPEFVILNILN